MAAVHKGSVVLRAAEVTDTESKAEVDTDTVFDAVGDNDQGRHKTFAIGSMKEQVAAVILTNGSNGTSIVPDLVEDILPGHHPCFDWLGYERLSSPAASLEFRGRPR